jgi:hypothetical protein
MAGAGRPKNTRAAHNLTMAIFHPGRYSIPGFEAKAARTPTALVQHLRAANFISGNGDSQTKTAGGA